MSPNNEILDLIKNLIESNGAVEIPALSLDAVVKNFVNGKYGAELDKIENEEEREKFCNKWITYYTEGEGRESMELEILNIKAQISAAKDSLKTVLEAATSATASNMIPSVITVGTATSTPNPAYTIIENKTKKNQLLTLLKTINAFLVSALKSCAVIMFPVPTEIRTLINTLTTVTNTVNAIPV